MDNSFSSHVLQRYKDFIGHFPGDQIIKSETEADVICPGHDDHNPSLGIDLQRNGHGPEAMMNCRSQGCDRKDILVAVGLTDQDRFFREDGGNGALPGCTLEQYAQYKHLPIEFLAGDEVGLEDDARWCPVAKEEVDAVRIPYATEDGEELLECSRYRTGLRKTSPDRYQDASCIEEAGRQAHSLRAPSARRGPGGWVRVRL